MEIDLHEAQGHTPYRNWCKGCVAGLCPDTRHEKNTDPETGLEIPVIEFDYAKSSGKTTDPESPIPFISASESFHQSQFASFIRKKGSGDEYVMTAFLNWIKILGHPKVEIKCDQEPSTIELRNQLIKRCESSQLVPYATPKGSKGSLGLGERTHLTIEGRLRAIKHNLEDHINRANSLRKRRSRLSFHQITY